MKNKIVKIYSISEWPFAKTEETLNRKCCYFCARTSTYVNIPEAQHMSTYLKLNICQRTWSSTYVNIPETQHMSTHLKLNICQHTWGIWLLVLTASLTESNLFLLPTSIPAGFIPPASNSLERMSIAWNVRHRTGTPRCAVCHIPCPVKLGHLIWQGLQDTW